MRERLLDRSAPAAPVADQNGVSDYKTIASSRGSKMASRVEGSVEIQRNKRYSLTIVRRETDVVESMYDEQFQQSIKAHWNFIKVLEVGYLRQKLVEEELTLKKFWDVVRDFQV